MKTILVTGENSQLAQSLKSISKTHKNLSFIYKSRENLDITNLKLLRTFFANHNFDYCINCAAYTAVDEAEEDYVTAERVNCSGVENLASFCKKNSIVLIHISTDFVFDGASKTPYTEENIPDPINTYGKTKYCGEKEILNKIQEYFIIRTSWLYSEFGNNFLKTMLRLSETKDEISVVDDQLGSPTYATDLARAIIKIINSSNSNFGIYHYCNIGFISWYEFAKSIFAFSNCDTKINRIQSIDYPTKAKRPKYSVLDTTKIQGSFGIEIPFWKESLKIAIASITMRKNLELAIKASLEAGKAIMEVYEGTIEVEVKEDKSPLTEADKRANEIINSYLKPTSIPIISEENKKTGYSTRKEWNECWIVDPVDGTKEFIKRNGEFTVNIALVNNGVPELGVIYVPESKTLYFGDVVQRVAYKAKLKEHHDKIESVFKMAILLKPKKNLKTLAVVGSRSHMSQETLDFVEDLKNQGFKVDIVSKGSSLKLCLVAEGKADIYPRFAPTMEWDTAAGQAICNAVGVDVISNETNKPLTYNKKNLLNPWFIVKKRDVKI